VESGLDLPIQTLAFRCGRLAGKVTLRLGAVEQSHEIEHDVFEVNTASFSLWYAGEIVLLSCLTHSCDRRASPVKWLNVAVLGVKPF